MSAKKIKTPKTSNPVARDLVSDLYRRRRIVASAKRYSRKNSRALEI